jgi:CspA family cold shock protein
MTGEIVTYIGYRGYGFIRSDQDGKDYYVHPSQLRGVSWEDLREGHRVTFEPGQGERGLMAKEVKREGTV